MEPGVNKEKKKKKKRKKQKATFNTSCTAPPTKRLSWSKCPAIIS